MDRPNKAGDNAQALFEYAVKQQDGIKKFFTINKDSSDYQSLKNIGTTIPWRSIRQLLYFLISDKIISSQADEIVINPFGRYQKYLFDLYKFDFIFLQHGITHNDLSGWLNKADKNIKLFITASEREYDSILNNNYLYSKEEVLLSGFPRYDKLNNTLKQKVLLMPTWRESLSTKVNKHGERGRNENFTESDYFKFYNNLINNKKLLKILEEKNYYIKFCLHPNLIPNAEDFEKNPFVKISTTICDYKKEFNEGAILITDYSSVVFDFAYLQKPVIYAQFDNERIFNENTYNKGYFNYKEDGFGPVCEDLKSTVNSIIKILENNSKLEDKYKQRVKEFFTYHDKKNCQRVYNAILELK
jgi:CDP-glycerol glycerophosphotransferase (TagB/SpsB family)